ncbi:DUF3159 domain-containing protein [Streptacidiphilus sp. PAMC 29251]
MFDHPVYVLWERSTRFRRIWRVSTAIWAAAMLLDGAARVVMAYTLPVDAVPALGAVLWPVTLVLRQVVNGVYYEVAGLWQITRPQPLAPRHPEPDPSFPALPVKALPGSLLYPVYY